MSQNLKSTLDMLGGGFVDGSSPLASTSNFTPSAGQDGLRRKFGIGAGGHLTVEE